MHGSVKLPAEGTAMKQCGNTTIPNPHTSYVNWVLTLKPSDIFLIKNLRAHWSAARSFPVLRLAVRLAVRLRVGHKHSTKLSQVKSQLTSQNLGHYRKRLNTTFKFWLSLLHNESLYPVVKCSYFSCSYCQGILPFFPGHGDLSASADSSSSPDPKERMRKLVQKHYWRADPALTHRRTLCWEKPVL